MTDVPILVAVVGGFLLLGAQKALFDRALARRYRADTDERGKLADRLATDNRRTELKVLEVRTLLELRHGETVAEQERSMRTVEELLGLNRKVLESQRESTVSADVRLDRVIARIAELEEHLKLRREEERRS